MNIFDQMLARYSPGTDDEMRNATREIMQQITLAGLYRGGFFNNAAFYGGTCLRIFYGIERFSEDMDFSLLESNPDFDLSEYFGSIKNEFKMAGKEVVIEKKQKKINAQIESAFLKEETEIYNLSFSAGQKIKIKIEVDVNPPPGFSTEYKLLLMPFSFMTRCYSLPSLFAGKLHALLYRDWKTRVKGRDWYDLVWYVRQEVEVDVPHFFERARQSGHIDDYPVVENIKDLLRKKIRSTSMDRVKADIQPFIRNPAEVEIYSADFFIQLVDMINWKTK
ncbi:MAG: nucleotidyl transferase AbiEii/AbiGii toxin family protein [Bacteroidota bacterium]